MPLQVNETVVEEFAPGDEVELGVNAGRIAFAVQFYNKGGQGQIKIKFDSGTTIDSDEGVIFDAKDVKLPKSVGTSVEGNGNQVDHYTQEIQITNTGGFTGRLWFADSEVL